MNNSLRPMMQPMDLGAILDRAVQVFRQQPLLFFGIAAIPGLVQLAATVVTPQLGVSGAAIAAVGVASFILKIAHWIVQAIASAAFCLAASAVYLGGTTTVRDAFNAFGSRKGRMVGLTFLQGLYAFWPLIIVAIVAGVVAATMGTGPGGVVAQVFIWTIGGLPCLYLFARYALAFPATAMEDLPATASLDRSVDLSQGSRMKIFLGILVPAVPGMALVFGSMGLIGYFKASSPLLGGSPLAVAMIEGVVALLSTLVFSPYGSIVLTLLYYDQRIRREGYDVERMMDAAGLNPNAAYAPVPRWPEGVALPILPTPAEALPSASSGAEEQQA